MTSVAQSGKFLKERLPQPEAFFRENLKQFRTRGRTATALCPFHPDHQPSLQIDLVRGRYFCHVCQLGGDILHFVKALHHVGFVQACKLLDAWGGASLSRTERRELELTRRRRERIARQAIDLVEQERTLRLAYRDTIHRMERLVSEMRQRLRDVSPYCADQDEYATCGSVLVMALDEQRAAVAAYCLSSFGMVAARMDFLLHPQSRDRVIATVLERGYVRDDHGRIKEVEFLP